MQRALVLIAVGCSNGGGTKPSNGSAAAEVVKQAPPPVDAPPIDAAPPDAPPPSKPGPPTPPIGSPKFCGGNDRTRIPLATSTFVSSIDITTARNELEARNDICGDTWCEGSFEWFFYDLRSDAARSELTMRTYSNFVSPKDADASKVVVTGDRYVGRVLRQGIVPSCTTPCKGFAEQPTWKPCLVLDLRCELATPWDERRNNTWDDDFIACGIALETAIRKIHPEFAP